MNRFENTYYSILKLFLVCHSVQQRVWGGYGLVGKMSQALFLDKVFEVRKNSLVWLRARRFETLEMVMELVGTAPDNGAVVRIYSRTLC